ncbi:MAG: hypothetical protein EOM67_01625 [Spirochaetia bacterium]|nr:hypothetical protein [Spirochaetia bacterium]
MYYSTSYANNWNSAGQTDNIYNDVVFGVDKFVAVGNKISVSYNSIDWTDVFDPYPGTEFNRVIFKDGIYIATIKSGEGGYISLDGINWKKICSTERIGEKLYSRESDTYPVYINNKLILASSGLGNFYIHKYPLNDTTVPGAEFRATNITNDGFDLFQGDNPLWEDFANKSDFSVDMYIEITDAAKIVATEDPLPTPVKIRCDATELLDGTKVLISGDVIVKVGDRHLNISEVIWLSSGRDAEGFFLRHLDGSYPTVSYKNPDKDDAIVYKYLGVVDGDYLDVDPEEQTVYFGSSTKIEIDPGRYIVYPIIPGSERAIKIAHILGQDQINNNTYDVLSVPGELPKVLSLFSNVNSGNSGKAIDSSSWPLYDPKDGNGYIYFSLPSDSAENLDHLVGEKVAICMNGNSDGKTQIVLPDGSLPIETPNKVFYMTIGIPYTSRLKTVPFSGGSLFGSSVGVTGSQKDAVIKLYYSLGGKYGSEFENMRMIPYQNIGSSMDKPVPLYTGLTKVSIENARDVYNRCICLEHDKPVSFNVLSITQDVIVSDA